VPASPELVLVPDLFDVIEKEVIDEHGGVLAYSLSLSAEPTNPVTVVISPEIRSPSCYGYEPKFALETSEFTFNSKTYNIAQVVTIAVNNLNASKYEGSFSALFHHTIVTEDKDFKSAFLRPVSVTLQDDSPCVDGAEKYDATHADKTRVRKCGCTEGFYIADTDPLHCDSVTKCEACPDGMECGKQQDFTLANLNENFYRVDNSSLNVVKCPDPATQCIGSATAGDRLCAVGHSGAFCMVCVLGEESRFVRSGEVCVLCDESSQAVLYVALAACLSLCIGVVIFISWNDGRSRRRWSQGLGTFAERIQVNCLLPVSRHSFPATYFLAFISLRFISCRLFPERHLITSSKNN
jgi:hypothetical protein